MNTQTEKESVPYIAYESELCRAEYRLKRTQALLFVSIAANVVIVILEHFWK